MIGCSCIDNFWDANYGNWKEFGMIKTQTTIMLIMAKK